MTTEARLGAADIEDLRRQLDAERSNLKREINTHLSDESDPLYASVVDAVKDRGEESVADLYADLGFARIERQVDRLKAVEEALYRVGQGIYGVCEECESAIGRERLRADPAVPRCIACQTRLESTPSAKDKTPSL